MAGRPVVIEAGLAACQSGAADLCLGCGKCRYRADMRWLVDLYRCRVCLGDDVGELPLMEDWGSSVAVKG